MDILGIILAVFVLGMVVALHELGHFFVAKWCGVGVLEYALGFGKALWSRRFGETRYSLRCVPLGGYVRMVGDDPFAVVEEKNHHLEVTPGTAPLSPENWAHEKPDEVEQRMMDDRSRWFLLKPVWKKVAIVFAGPFANLLSAFILAVFTLGIWGATVPVDVPVIGQLIPGYPAAKAGLKLGDKVVSVDGKSLQTWEDLSKSILNSGGKELLLHVERTKPDAPLQTLDIKVTGQKDSDELSFIDKSLTSNGYKIGIGAPGKREQVGWGEAVEIAGMHIYKLASMSVRGIAGLAIGVISLKNIGGPIFIFGETMRSASQGVADLLEFIVFLSVSLGVLNLLPIPVLDGGHILFFIIEAIKGKPVSTRVIELAHQAGMVLLLLLTALAIGNDVLRLVHGG